jgi:hypothetical protein
VGLVTVRKLREELERLEREGHGPKIALIYEPEWAAYEEIESLKLSEDMQGVVIA